MLHDFLLDNRATIIAMTHARVAAREFPRPTEVELVQGVPRFLDQLCDALRIAEARGEMDHSQIQESANLHGEDLFRIGLTVAQVVHDYGDICQAVTELAIQQNATIQSDEFQTLNLCLDDAIAGAVTSYSRHRENAISARDTERLGVLAHELRNLLATAMLAFDSIQSGRVPPNGSTGLVLNRCLSGLREIINRSLSDVRLDAGIEQCEDIPLTELLEEIEATGWIQAQLKKQRFVVEPPTEALVVNGDRQILVATVFNLLQNAFKFSKPGGLVTLKIHRKDDHVIFEIEDECGGLPPGAAEHMFQAFGQQGADHSGLGLGLSICQKAAKAHSGELHVRDLPGHGCVFTLELPSKPAGG